MAKNNASKDNFEFKLKRVEEISAKLDSEQIGLEEAIALYEEGVSLSNECYEILKNAELKIKELKKQSLIINDNEEVLS